MRPQNFPQQQAPQTRQAAIDPEHAEQAAERARAVQWLAEHAYESTLSRFELSRLPDGSGRIIWDPGIVWSGLA